MTGVSSGLAGAAAERDRHQDLGAAVDVVDARLPGLAGLDDALVLARLRADAGAGRPRVEHGRLGSRSRFVDPAT